MPERHTVQQAGPEEESSRGGSRQTLQRRVQNALRWRSWGGEAETAASNALSSTSAPGSRPFNGPGRHVHRAGRSAGSDVELSALPSTTTSSISSDVAILGSPAATGGFGEHLARSTFGSNKSSTSSAAGAGHPTDAGPSSVGAGSSSAAGMQHPQQQHWHQQQGAAAIGIPGAADDACSTVTQAGSTAHSFTSLYSMLADQGEAGSEAAGPSAAAAGVAGSSLSHAAGAMSPFRGSDAGGDAAASVSTLPLISEAAYDDEQQLMQEVDELASGEGVSGRVSGFDELEEEQREDELGAQRRAAQHGALVMSGISGRPRVSSSHGSIASAASDASLSAPASTASGPLGSVAAAIGTRTTSPAGASSSSGRPVYGSQRSGSGRHSVHQQLQQQQGTGDSRNSTELPLPFGMRKRPDNDETCSYTTQAGSVHSVSSVLSSAFADSAPQPRTSGSGAAATAAAGQQLLIHPLAEPADELACFEEEDGSLSLPGRSSSVADDSVHVNHRSLSSPGSSSSSSQQREQLGNQVGRSWDMEQQQQQQWQEQQGQGGSSAAAATAAAGGVHGALERKGSLKGALRSVVAWGNGLSQRLQRSSNEKQSSHKQQQGAGRPGASSSRSDAQPAGPLVGQQQSAAAAVGSGHELASL